MTVTLRHLTRTATLARGGASAAVGLLVAAVVIGDRAAPRHSAWRDPISWFAAAEAPHPTFTRVAMLAVAVVIAVVAWRWRHLPWGAATVAMLAIVVAVLALVPLECSPRIEFCRALMRHGKIGGPHLVHAAVAAVGLMLAAATAVAAARRDRRRWVVGAAVIAVVAGGWMLADPSSSRLGTLQWIFLAASSLAISTLGRPADATCSSAAR